MPKFKRKNFYAVVKGYNSGLYNSWDECQKQVQGFPGCIFKGFDKKEEAETFLNENLNQNTDRDYAINSILKQQTPQQQKQQHLSPPPSSPVQQSILPYGEQFLPSEQLWQRQHPGDYHSQKTQPVQYRQENTSIDHSTYSNDRPQVRAENAAILQEKNTANNTNHTAVASHFNNNTKVASHYLNKTGGSDVVAPKERWSDEEDWEPISKQRVLKVKKGFNNAESSIVPQKNTTFQTTKSLNVDQSNAEFDPYGEDETSNKWSDEEDWDPTIKQQIIEAKKHHDPHHLNTIAQSSSIDDIELTGEQTHVLNLVINSQESIFYTGSAGTGKSILLQRIIKEVKRLHGPESIAVTAPTGIAAVNVGGMTIHSFSGVGTGDDKVENLLKKIKRRATVQDRWKEIKVLVIDEVSMLDGALFDKLELIARDLRQSQNPFGGIQVIITGDFYQLPPVSKGGEYKFCFQANSWQRVVKHSLLLTRIFRQKDNELINMLNEMRHGGNLSNQSMALIKRLQMTPQYPPDGILPTELYARNESVNKANQSHLDRIPYKAQVYLAEDFTMQSDSVQLATLKKSCLAYDHLELKRNAQVMLIKNLNKDLVNGSRGIVIGFHDAQTNSHYFNGEEEKLPPGTAVYPIVRFTNKIEQVIDKAIWTLEGVGGIELARRRQVPLVLAWAISIHKSQGQTLDRVKVDLGRVFEKGQAYVALSRATSVNSLQVLNFRKDLVMAHKKVAEYYASLTTFS
ncbi:9443_t:CDS:2 [Ambispora gerdemannii]|uniref:ATP-dependent DNA helicase PIF1 n=1 Tax=Ambispora gerdemannii TaxID=144530 RepID=A0A9N8ZJ08_9GLOM|nr:9443_t:CDS:2 [Ambispora gerdemannii]